tara:strand:+ start:61 stop:465 length:405 start_codon:yes stop_codon:yes gene_type:complete
MNFFLFTTTCLLAYNAYLLLKDKPSLISFAQKKITSDDCNTALFSWPNKMKKRHDALEILLHKTMPINSIVKLKSYGKVKIVDFDRYDALGKFEIVFLLKHKFGYECGRHVTLEWSQFEKLLFPKYDELMGDVE